MSLSASRLAAAIVSELKIKGFALDDAPRMGSTGKSGVEVMIDALADGVVDEIVDHYEGEGPGGSGYEPFVHTQSPAAITWGPIANPFARPCSVELIDSAGNEFEADVVHASDFSTVTIQLKFATAGKAVLL